MKKELAMLVGAALVLGGYTGYAKSEVYELNPVVVTATRSPIELNKAPANISVITGKEIEKSHYSDLSQALRNVSNVYIANYGGGVGYQNSNSFYINGNNNVVWMVDGIVMNSTGLNAPLVTMQNLSNIERIEVLKGASSALYGSSAVGGVINIITKKPADGISNSIRVLGGSYGQEQYSFNTEGRKEGWHWRANYQKDIISDYKDAEGLTIPQHQNASSYAFNLGYALDENNDVTFYFDKYKADQMYSDSNKKLNLRKFGQVNKDTWRGVWTNKINGNLDNRFTLLYNHYKSNANGYKLDIASKGWADQFTWTGDTQTIVAGFDWHQDKVKSLDNVKLTNMSYYLQDEWKIAPQWTLTPGIRLDHHSAFGNHTSPHVSLAYEINPNTNTYISYNSYFVAPSATHLYSPKYGDPSLKPETGHSLEVGMSHQFSATMAGQISWFTRSSDDKLGYLRSTGHYANIDKEKANGLNLDIRKQFTKELTGHFGYTYTHVDPTPQRATNVDGYIPKHAVVFGLSYTKPTWDAQLDVRGNIDRKGPQTADVAAIPNNKFFPKDTYWVADLSANYHATPDLTIFGRVNNLFNTFYAEHSNARQNWWGQANEWWTAPGRNYQLGIEYKF